MGYIAGKKKNHDVYWYQIIIQQSVIPRGTERVSISENKQIIRLKARRIRNEVHRRLLGENERANASYAMQAFTAEAIPGGMRIVSPFRQITDRGGALDVGTITTEFISVRKDIISVRSYHYEGYVKVSQGMS